jgi:membrane associated rhomboid family serine protease
MAAAVCVAPRMPIRFWFPPITIELWVIFLVAIVLALLAIRTWSNNAGGEAAHLGGAAAGLIAFTFRKKLGMVRSKKKSKFWNTNDPSSSFLRDGK